MIPAVLEKIDKRQYGTISKSCTTHALVNMIHNWHVSSDWNSAVIIVVLFDFRKAFYLIDHNIVIFKKVTTFFNFEDMFRCYKHHRQLQNI